MTYEDRREHERRRHARHTERMKRTRDTIDAALHGFEFEPSYLLSDGEYLHPHVECSRCHAMVRAVGMTPFDHWATHHRLRAAFLRWWRRKTVVQQAEASGDHPPMKVTVNLSKPDAKPVHSERPDERTS